nr:hypothetical protein [Propionibacterium sp.]
MANPVLSRPEAFQRPDQYAQPGPQGYQQYGQPPYGQAPYAQPQYGQAPYAQQPYAQQYGYQPAPVPSAGGVMTIEDVITKSGITMGGLFLVAAAVFMVMPLSLLMPTIIVTAIVGFITVLLVSMRRTVSPVAVVAYTVIEGLFIGALSKMFEYLFPGIVVQAILGTFVAAGVTLAAYKYFRIRVTNKFRRIVTIATMGIAAMYLVNLVVSLFGVSTGLVAVGPSAGPLSWIVSAVAVVLAVASLIMDFDYIEQGIRNGAPASESWRAAFGLTVTMVWLYTEILRILSYFRE